MLKKIRILAIAAIIILTLIPYTVFADENEENEEIIDINEIIQSSTEVTNEPVINAKSAVIYDRTSKEIIWGKKNDEKRAMASTTKIMSTIIVLENSNLSDVVTISKKAANTGGSCLKVNTGDKITVNDLLYGLMLRSGNDAAVALAEYVGGSVEGFAELMNKKAKELNLTNTNFVTPHGLDDPEHYTTAYELALLTDYALNNKKFATIVNTKNCTIRINGKERNINNTNELLGNLNGVDGVKTGFTGNAMRCLVTSCTRDGNQIITVVLGSDTKKQRTSDSTKLIEYAFKNYDRINIEEIAKKEFENWKQINSKRIYINKANDEYMQIELEEIKNKIIPIKKGKEKDIKIEINAIYTYEAPIKKGDKIGNLIIKENEEIIEIVDIVCSKEIYRKNVLDYIQYFLDNIVNCNI